MENQAKRVLLTSDGDEISKNIAFHLAKRGCRFYLNSRINEKSYSVSGFFFSVFVHLCGWD